MTITKIDNDHVAEISSKEHRRLWSKEELTERKEVLEKQLTETNQLLDALK